MHFISNQESPYYQSPVFSGILRYVQQNQELFQMKEGKKLTLTVQNINNINKALKMLNDMKENL